MASGCTRTVIDRVLNHQADADAHEGLRRVAAGQMPDFRSLQGFGLAEAFVISR